MVKILFICHGNICRSPMAQMILDNYIKTNKLENQISVEQWLVQVRKLEIAFICQQKNVN